MAYFRQKQRRAVPANSKNTRRLGKITGVRFKNVLVPIVDPFSAPTPLPPSPPPTALAAVFSAEAKNRAEDFSLFPRPRENFIFGCDSAQHEREMRNIIIIEATRRLPLVYQYKLLVPVGPFRLNYLTLSRRSLRPGVQQQSLHGQVKLN